MSSDDNYETKGEAAGSEVVDVVVWTAEHFTLSEHQAELPVPLTEAEWREAAEQQGATWLRILAEEDGEKERRADYNRRRKALKADHDSLARLVDAKTQPRQVRCRVFGIASSNEAVVVRLDTAAVVARRALTAAERERVLQLELIPGGKAPTPTPTPDPDAPAPLPFKRPGVEDGAGDILAFVGLCREMEDGADLRTTVSTLLERAAALSIDTDGIKVKAGRGNIAAILRERAVEKYGPSAADTQGDDLPEEA